MTGNSVNLLVSCAILEFFGLLVAVADIWISVATLEFYRYLAVLWLCSSVDISRDFGSLGMWGRSLHFFRDFGVLWISCGPFAMQIL